MSSFDLAAAKALDAAKVEEDRQRSAGKVSNVVDDMIVTFIETSGVSKYQQPAFLDALAAQLPGLMNSILTGQPVAAPSGAPTALGGAPTAGSAPSLSATERDELERLRKQVDNQGKALGAIHGHFTTVTRDPNLGYTEQFGKDVVAAAQRNMTDAVAAKGLVKKEEVKEPANTVARILNRATLRGMPRNRHIELNESEFNELKAANQEIVDAVK